MSPTPYTGLFLIPCPQHPKAAEPCCLGCGNRDGRVKAGALFCHDCIEDQVPGSIPPRPRS